MRKIALAFLILTGVSVAHAQIAPNPAPPLNGQPGQPAGPLTITGRLPDSQLAITALQYKGAWNAATNTPTLANGTGVVGDMYAISTSGSQNLGGGSVSYVAGNYLLYNGTVYEQIGSGTAPSPANPSAQIGTSAINGTAQTFMRSDAAPPINLAITPTWTGAHAFASNVTVQGLLSSTNNTTPAGPTNSGVALSAAPDVADVLFFDATQSVNNRTYEAIAFQGCQQFRFKNDAGSAAIPWLKGCGGQAAGVTGITSNSGSGSWVHTGGFSVNNFNNITLTPSISGGTPTISSAGGNANVSLGLATQGTGAIVLAPGGTGQLVVNASDIQAASGYTPANAQSLATKAYVDGATGGGPVLASGTYTPTVVYNSGASSGFVGTFMYQRVGNVVTVTGTMSIAVAGAPGSSGNIRLSLPIASNIGFSNQAVGFGTTTLQVGQGSFSVIGFSGDNSASLTIWSANTNSNSYGVTFSYTVQ
ncbi:hypothetical protein RHSP_32039 [Rhizobium freirei PRF 81]|uniref:Uncharacterized protein n=1 Tax=Rhizobium freirei PRF 81 TaxID=363754 RepID=N6V508_9HYPH|nr:hypothetical protein [Rhizobium freirei]ENN86072.1 hypothetical protein RHSP_32039 [Rhizobium freirei PRF 81]